MDRNTIFDSHFHIIDPRFPLIPNQGYLPETFTLADYKEKTSTYDVIGGTIVSGSFQGFDQSYLVEALSHLNDSFVGVTQLQADVSEKEISNLHHKGVRAVRFNLKRGGSESIEQLEYFAKKLFETAGWHVEFYIDSKDLDLILNKIKQLPAFSIDHLGLSSEGLPALLKLVELGAKVKATGFSRTNFDVLPVLRQIYDINPHSLMFGTDLPSTRAPASYSEKDLKIILENFDKYACENILINNARRFYLKQ